MAGDVVRPASEIPEPPISGHRGKTIASGNTVAASVLAPSGRGVLSSEVDRSAIHDVRYLAESPYRSSVTRSPSGARDTHTSIAPA